MPWAVTVPLFRWLKRRALCGKAVLGINVGRLGFVASLEKNEMNELDKLVQGTYTIEKRMMLDVWVGQETTPHAVLNDAVAVPRYVFTYPRF